MAKSLESSSEKPGKSGRYFIGTSVPESLGALLVNAKIEFPGIKWTIPENLHLTLYFIGNITKTKEDLLVSSIKEAISGIEPFPVQFDKILYWPERKPKMVWAKFHQNIQFTRLSDHLHKNLGQFCSGNAPHKEPIPHITMARLKKVNSSELPVLKQVVFENLIISGCYLFESVSGKEGVRYVKLHRFDFGK